MVQTTMWNGKVLPLASSASAEMHSIKQSSDTVTLSPSSRVYGSQGQSAGSDPNLVKFGSLPATDITEVGGS